MLISKPLLIAAVILAGLGLHLPAQAQDVDAATATAEQLQAQFQKQKTRGLKLVTSTDAAALPTVSGAAGTVISPVAYSEIEKEAQINVRISFDFDSAVLRPDERPKLATLCTAMKTADVGVFRIVGHTDASGTDAYNEKLSLLRAEEVKRFLVDDCGIPTARLEAVGMGKRFLFNKDDPKAEENRRVEFQALS
ncbi:OmpA family protein [Pseudorhodobacter sp.]|uniref:OmpA family protein n=1 Tax=Pseudorhodobacter sp. TaxID=1934400 RepID=UPI00264982A1|nr:OmpA family protein [Pseudorhodobacter sp.]MDN5788028.1 OmpA family protein [Pseudorhodobacter sp.]